MFCPKCGTKLDDESRFCASCGTDLTAYLEPGRRVSKTKKTERKPVNKSTSNTHSSGDIGIEKIGIIIQAVALAVYGIYACRLHERMSQYDLFSVSQVGKPMHTMYVVAFTLGICLIIYGLVMTLKRKEPFKRYAFIAPIITTIVTLFNSGANKVYTYTSGGSLSGFLGYGFSVGRNGYDPIDNFYYSKATVPQYVFVAIIGIAIAIFTITKFKDNNAPDKTVKAVEPEITDKANDYDNDFMLDSINTANGTLERDGLSDLIVSQDEEVSDDFASN